MNETTKALLISEVKQQRKTLRTWFLIYITTWLLGIILLLTLKSRTDVAIILWGGSIIPYIVCLVYSYKVQVGLFILDLTEGSGTAVIVGGLLLNPLFMGFVIPLWVFIDSRKIERTRVEPHGGEERR